jgi:Methyltransferase FkbM domain
VTRRRFWLVIAAVAVTLAILGAVLNNQVQVYRGRQATAATSRQRQALFDMLRPVALFNCQLERFGEKNDGGYLMCGNLLDQVQSAYSYGISGYDQWGCDISTRFKLTVHQYDCFNTTEPACPAGRTDFHAECVGDSARRVEGREFDTIKNQFAKNGDQSKRIVLKIDVEGAEWESFRSAPDDVFDQIDQMSVEFHWLHDEQAQWLPSGDYQPVMQRLKQFFEVAHVHFNNASCVGELDPFPTWAYEVLFVSKRLAVVDPSRTVTGLDPLDAPNNPSFPDCQPAPR